MMNKTRWVILGLVLISAGWMLFDGTRALIVGDFVTPATGDYAGQLGPWTVIVRAVGIEPRSTLMKVIFVVQGLITLGVAVCYALNLPWARNALLIMACLGLWYLPFGTLANALVIALLLFGKKSPA